MTKILTPVAAYGSNPTFPEDGVDPETAAGLEISVQTALNRAELNKSVIDGGVPKLRTVANIAALKAVTGQATGQHAFVKDFGTFEFDGASIASSDDVTVVTPAAGGGRWLLGGRSIRVANGFAPLDATAKVPSANLRGHLLSRATASISGSSGTIVSPGILVANIATVTMAIGQSWEMFLELGFKKANGADNDGNVAFLVLEIVQPNSSGATVVGSQFHTHEKGVGVFLPYGTSGRFFATQAGSHTVRLRTAIVIASMTYEISSGTLDHYLHEAA